MTCLRLLLSRISKQVRAPLSSHKLWQALQTPPSERWRFLIHDRLSNRSSWTPWAYTTVVLLVLTVGVIVLFNGALWGAFIAYRTASTLIREQYFQLLLVWITIAAMMYIDPIYGLISGGLVGIIAARYIRTDSHIFAVFTITILQAVGYVALLNGFLLFTALYRVLDMGNSLIMLTLPIISLGIFVATREGTIWILWRIVQHRMSKTEPIF